MLHVSQPHSLDFVGKPQPFPSVRVSRCHKRLMSMYPFFTEFTDLIAFNGAYSPPFPAQYDDESGRESATPVQRRNLNITSLQSRNLSAGVSQIVLLDRHFWPADAGCIASATGIWYVLARARPVVHRHSAGGAAKGTFCRAGYPTAGRGASFTGAPAYFHHGLHPTRPIRAPVAYSAGDCASRMLQIAVHVRT